jgi:hypothetical protein
MEKKMADWYLKEYTKEESKTCENLAEMVEFITDWLSKHKPKENQKYRVTIGFEPLEWQIAAADEERYFDDEYD